MLTFVIPVRHPSSIADPTMVKRMMAETLASIAAQTHPDWICVVAAERDADLPDLPPKVEVVTTDIPAPHLPDIRSDKQGNRRAIRVDKGARILAGLVAAQPRGHVMVVDYDDFISHRLAALSAAEPEADGWYFDCGLLYSGGAWISRYRREFYRFCGTSHIVHSRLLDIPRTVANADPDFVARMLGSHVYIRDALAAQGTPLIPLRFDGAVYRIGHADASSRSSALRRHLFNRRTLRTPMTFLQNALSLRPITPAFRKEFFGG